MNNHVIWLTGLSGSGKSTVANELYKRLKSEGIERIEILDGDDIRSNLSAELGYSKNDRNVNIKRIGYVTSLLARNDVWVIVAAISPYREVREELKRNINNFIEVYCKCPVEVLKQRDPKGLYKKALSGKIKNFTGLDDPYEEPLRPEICLETDREKIIDSVNKIMSFLGFTVPLAYYI